MTRNSPTQPAWRCEDYTVCWICLRRDELDAAEATLDAIHEPPDEELGKTYTFGSIGSQNIVLSHHEDIEHFGNFCLAGQIRETFPSLAFGLFVGVCSRTLVPVEDIHQGDVVVSPFPEHNRGLRVRKTIGSKAENTPDESWPTLDTWPDKYVAGIATALQCKELTTQKVWEYLQTTYLQDRHSAVQPRVEHTVSQPQIHYSDVFSGDLGVGKSSIFHRLAEKVHGLTTPKEVKKRGNQLPSLLVRGIFDVNESTTSTESLPYAAHAAAAYTKNFLRLVSRLDRISENETINVNRITNPRLTRPNIPPDLYNSSPFKENAAVVTWDLLGPNESVQSSLMPTPTSSVKSASRFEETFMKTSVREMEVRLRKPDNLCVQVTHDKICPGKIYRGICKLVINFENDPLEDDWYGTGWMIDNHTIVTAGHVVYDLEYGHACRIQAWLGYNGEPPAKGPNTQREYLYAAHVGLHAGFHEMSRAEHDLAVIQVEAPGFKNVTALAYNNTEPNGHAQLKIVGYPVDDFSTAGEIMWESSGKQKWNLKGTKYKIWHYLDTAPGSSGAPVLLESENGALTVIGVHTWGSKKKNFERNEAVPIGKTVNVGDLGNVIPAFERALQIHRDPRKHNYHYKEYPAYIRSPPYTRDESSLLPKKIKKILISLPLEDY